MNVLKHYEPPMANVIKFDKEGIAYIFTSNIPAGGHGGGNPGNTPVEP